MDNRKLADGAFSGALTFAWYAMSDVVPSRSTRALLKTGICAAAVGEAALRVRAVRSADRAADGDAGAAPGSDAPEPSERAPDGLDAVRALTGRPPVLDGAGLGIEEHLRVEGYRRLARMSAVGALALAASIAMTVAAERGVHRFGEYLGSRGVRAPHTLVGAVSGLAVAVLAVVTPDPSDPERPEGPVVTA